PVEYLLQVSYPGGEKPSRSAADAVRGASPSAQAAEAARPARPGRARRRELHLPQQDREREAGLRRLPQRGTDPQTGRRARRGRRRVADPGEEGAAPHPPARLGAARRLRAARGPGRRDTGRVATTTRPPAGPPSGL